MRKTVRLSIMIVATGLVAGCVTKQENQSSEPRQKSERMADAPVGTRIRKKSRDTSPVSGVSGAARDQERVQASAAWADAVNKNAGAR